MPEAIRSLAPGDTVMHELGNGSVGRAAWRGGSGRSFSAPRGSGTQLASCGCYFKLTQTERMLFGKCRS